MHSPKRIGESGPLSISSTYSTAPSHASSHDEDGHSESTHVSLESSEYLIMLLNLLVKYVD